ncbi:hypothetical protein [Microcystis sp. LE19-55.1A]|jgi:hypothetical protein|nr:hypothetical protein [Microcystis sp. LE19-55.1A]MCZ8308501.1 hypothetical protein [Microcystis sp. LE19-98.1E]
MMSNTGKIRFLCEDETRLGLKTISGRKITAKGVKPYGKVQGQFQATYIYGSNSHFETILRCFSDLEIR